MFRMFQSEIYEIMDAMFHDVGILNDPHNNDTYYAYRSSYTRQSDGTLIETTHTTADGFLMIDETGDTKPFHSDLCFECDIIASTGNNGFALVGDVSRNIRFGQTSTGFHVKLEVKSTGITLTIDEGTPSSYNTVTGNYDIRFLIVNGATVKFKNAVLYPI